MKKKEQKAIVKEQKKAAKKDLIIQLTSALSTVTATLGTDKKIGKIVAKGAKQLAEKLSKSKVQEVTPISTETITVDAPVLKKAPKKKLTTQLAENGVEKPV